MPPRAFRTELKFLVHHSVRAQLMERWRRHLVQAPFTNRHAIGPILSQYYDSPTLDFYQDKLAGIGSRKKVRLRTYGQALARGQTTFLEIKQRENDKVRKHRYKIPQFDESWLEPSSWRIDDPAMRAEFLSLMHVYHLRRSAQVYYQREAYEGAIERDVRVTFDTCVLALHPGERLTRELLFDRSRRILSDTMAVLEVKATDDIPRWVHEGVVAFELEQRTVPKYVAAVEQLELQENVAAGVYA